MGVPSHETAYSDFDAEQHAAATRGPKRRRVDQEVLPPLTGAEGNAVEALLQLRDGD